MMKRRVETGHLGQVRESTMKRFRQEDLLRQMLRSNGLSWHSSSTNPAVMRCGSLYFGPPCTTRCPTAVNPSRPLRSSIQSIREPTATLWSGAATGREKLSAWFNPFTRKQASGSPIRSIPPASSRRSEPPASNSANLILDERSSEFLG